MRKVPFKSKASHGYAWFGNYLQDDDGRLPKGGIILQDLKHGHYGFAKEARVAGLCVEFETFSSPGEISTVTTAQRYYALSRDHFDYEKPEFLGDTLGQVQERIKLLKKKGTNVYDKKGLQTLYREKKTYVDLLLSMGAFSTYDFVEGIRAKYQMTTLFDLPNCEFQHFHFEQTFLFTDYDQYPAHEPSGNLMATRLFPLIKTRFEKNPDFSPGLYPFTKVKSIRVDYRFHPRSDTFLSAADAVNSLAKDKDLTKEQAQQQVKQDFMYILKNKPQQAAVFRDSESAGLVESGAKMGQAADILFEAAEKPLIYELGSIGLFNGFPMVKKENTEIRGWDNVHWWGGYKDTHIPSAPGAFHALHLHWRWGGAIKNTILPPSKGQEPQFLKSAVPQKVLDDPAYEGLVGPLVDPHAWIQTLRFAVIVYDPQKNDVPHENFFAWFKNNQRSPKNIQDGTNLELWYSVEISAYVIIPGRNSVKTASGKTVDFSARKVEGSLDGTIFLHGMFFAHEEEPSFSPTIGGQNKEYLPGISEANEKRIKKAKRFNRFPYFLEALEFDLTKFPF